MAIIALVCAAIAAVAQVGQTSSIKGKVVDPNGAVVSETTVLLISLKNLDTRKAKANSQGEFTFEDVSPGEYQLIAKHLIFDATLKRLNVTAGKTRKLIVKLGCKGGCKGIE